MGLPAGLCYALARRRVLGRRMGEAGHTAHSFDADKYREQRRAELRRQFTEHFSPDAVRGKQVLDLGCGEGGLSFLAAEMGAAGVVGTDLSADCIGSARRELEQHRTQTPIRFDLAATGARLDYADASFDAILCFDVLEHIMDIEAIVPELRRVLRPGGTMLIWWVPWWHPYGPHIESLVPLPWAHVLFSDKALIQTCARIYDMPEFQPRIWDRDAAGNKKPNKWKQMDTLPGVNKLTMHRFEQLCRANGLDIAQRELTGFRSGKLAPLTHALLRIPRLREFFASCVTYVIERPAYETQVSGRRLGPQQTAAAQ
jgi:SAM-dependent methyltransferase